RGVWARSLWPADAGVKYDDDDPHEGIPSGSEALRGYLYKGDISKDQIAGLAFGWAMALACVPGDAALRATIAEDATALADHLLEHDLVLHDADGDPSTYASIEGRIVGVPIGVHASIALGVFKVAAVATG